MKVIFLFPGYGAHFVGMCKELYDSSRLVQEYFEEASNCLSLNFVKLCFASSDNDLALMSHAYPALFLSSVAVSAVVQEAGIQPSAVAGFGIGEFSALCAAKSINLPDGLYLLTKLAALYNAQKELYSGIRVTGISSRNLNQLMCQYEGEASIAYYINGDEHIITGLVDAIESIEKELKNLKIKSKKVSIAHGLYSSLAQSIFEEYRPHMVKVDIKDLKFPLISSHDAKEVNKGYSARERLSKSIISPVKWPQVIKKLSEYDMIIEVGPRSPYIDQLKSQFSNILSVSKPEDLEAAKSMYAQILGEVDLSGTANNE